MGSTNSSPFSRQLERILDEASSDSLNVIVQVDSDPSHRKELAKAAGLALSRRRMSLTPRELLPAHQRGPVSNKLKQETASTRVLLGNSKIESLTLKKMRRMGREPVLRLMKSNIVQSAIARMTAAARKSGSDSPSPQPFFTSRAIPLKLSRDELHRLPGEVTNLRFVHLNRTLKVPVLMENRPLAMETDDLLSSTWGLRRMNALAFWGATECRGRDTTIGLLDTGVDASHPDLTDSSGNSKVSAWAEFDSLGHLIKSPPRDSDEHGTHCAGTIVGGSQSGRHIGVAPHAKLAAALVLSGDTGGTDAQILAGIDWCVEQGVDVISMSLGGLVMDAETPPTYTEAILSCVEAGIPVVAAIGNEGEQTSGSPGNDLFALSVGATDPADRVAGFSGGRTQIVTKSVYIDPQFLPLPYSKPDLSAPGVAVYSTVPGAKWKAASGTSMAAPHDAGALALLLSATRIKELESGQRRTFLLYDLITGSVEDLGESGQDHRYGFGRLDVLRAYDFACERGYSLEPKP